jgi:outer membrane protein OmpA-like peptidoglycan-associated protein
MFTPIVRFYSLVSLVMLYGVSFVSAQTLSVGVNIGASSSVTEAPTRPLKFLSRLSALYEFDDTWGVETSLTAGTLGSSSPGAGIQWDFSSAILATDVRLRYVPLTISGWKPFVTVGLGAIAHSTRDIPANVQPSDVLSGVSVLVPVGIGVRRGVSSRWSVELSAATNMTFGDDLNPLRDGKNDAYWSVMIGASYNLTMLDSDGDGLSDSEEKSFGTDPQRADTDNDGLGDAEEVKNYMTSPLKADTDGDGLTDQQEIFSFKTNPLKADTDDDGLSDGAEIMTYLTDPLNPDSDDDTLTDGDEVMRYKTSPTKADTDNDGLRDDDELLRRKTNPLLADTDGDGLSDGDEVNTYRTNPLEPDTDGGQANDGLEVQRRTNPLNSRDDERALRNISGAFQQMQTLSKGSSMVLDGIEFDVGKATIRASSEPTLEAIYTALLNTPDMMMEISGHTDSDGRRETNIALSQDRADAVKAWLVARGVEFNRLIARGYGPDRPLVQNSSVENKQRNRRIECVRIK